MIRIGDIVRFLNDVGGGRVVEIKGSTVTVEDSDGFRIPCPERECVVVESAAIKDAGAKPSEKAFSGEIQTRGGDMLEISLAYVPASQSGAAAGDYDVAVEAELGRIPGFEDLVFSGHAEYTDPEAAVSAHGAAVRPTMSLSCFRLCCFRFHRYRRLQAEE